VEGVTTTFVLVQVVDGVVDIVSEGHWKRFTQK
jgi:hypothetical protein